VLVLGLDPGSRHTGWGLVDCQGSRLAARGWGRLSPLADAALPQRLALLASGLTELLERHRPELAAVERVFHGANSRSLVVLAEARGALLLTLARFEVPIVELEPARVKSAVAGHGGAGKDQVARMVRLQLALGEQPLPADASDALAIAIACGQSTHPALRPGLLRDWSGRS
jgi:crossover junction endodeoxyribonuclease RuvC